MKDMIKRRKDEGFTLIELMIVIAVIGILAIVLMPKMSGLKTGAKLTGVKTNGASVHAYVVSSMDQWVIKGLSQQHIAERISLQFSGDNALRNPLSGETTQSSDINTAMLIQTNKLTGDTDVAAVSGTIAKTDALQILTELDLEGDPAAEPPVDPYDDGVGTVVVVVADTYATEGIRIIGFDDKGEINSDLKVKP